MTKFDSLLPGNLGSPTQHDLRNAAREHVPDALALIIKVLDSPRATPQARIAAARSLLERGWGDTLVVRVRPHREEALGALLDVMNDAKVSLRTRLVAADVLLDYAGSEAGEPAVVSGRQRWLDELREIQKQLAAGRPTFDRPPGNAHN